MAGGLVLRDIHVPEAPPLWPPAPGWWLLAMGLALLAVAWWWFARRRRRRQAELAQVFERALAGLDSPPARLAAASELLRRAARRVRPDADRLDGQAWLAFLDGPRRDFSTGPGRLLLDGPFRPALDPRDAEAAVALARRRFVDLMGRRR